MNKMYPSSYSHSLLNNQHLKEKQNKPKISDILQSLRDVCVSGGCEFMDSFSPFPYASGCRIVESNPYGLQHRKTTFPLGIVLLAKCATSSPAN